MLARMGALLGLEARPAHSPALNDLKDLHMAREALVKNRTAAKNRAKNLTLTILKRHNAEQLRQIERQITAIETEIMARIEADPDLVRRFAILVSIPGVSAITAFALIIDMPELGALDHGQAAALAGLLPSRASPGNGPAVPLSAAAAPMSDRHSTCRHSSPSASIPTSGPSTTSSKPPARPRRSR